MQEFIQRIGFNNSLPLEFRTKATNLLAVVSGNDYSKCCSGYGLSVNSAIFKSILIRKSPPKTMVALLAAYVAKVNAERKMKKRTYPLIQTTDYQLAFRVFVERLAQRPASGFESSKPTALKISDVKKKTAETRASALEKLNKHDASKKLLYEMRVKPQQDPWAAIFKLRNNKGLAYGNSMSSNRFRLLEFEEIKEDVEKKIKKKEWLLSFPPHCPKA